MVTVRFGERLLPYSHGSIGSSTMANAGASIMPAAKAARDKAIALAIGGKDAPFGGAAAHDVVVSGGRRPLGGRNLPFTYLGLPAREPAVGLAGGGTCRTGEKTKGAEGRFSVFARVR